MKRCSELWICVICMSAWHHQHLCMSACITDPWVTYSKQLIGHELCMVCAGKGLAGSGDGPPPTGGDCHLVTVPPLGGGGGVAREGAGQGGVRVIPPPFETQRAWGCCWNVNLSLESWTSGFFTFLLCPCHRFSAPPPPTWDGRAHVLWVTGTLQVLPRVKRMFFGDNGGVGDVMRVLHRYLLSAPHSELVGSREGGGM